jgi:hypothetical protein
MAIEEYEINSIADLLVRLGELSARARVIWFRGHSRTNWQLSPSLARMNKLGSEIQLMKRFKQNAYQFLNHIPQYEWEWMFLMQHYGVPTRLLDWTENPLVALYFATREDNFLSGERKPLATLWCLLPRKLNEMSGIAMRSPDDILAFGEEEELSDYLPSRVSEGLTSKNPVAIIASRQFGRVVAQQGVFTIMHKECKNIEELHDSDGNQHHVIRLNIPRKRVGQIRKELDLLRINKLFVFPQLENVAEEAVAAL